jgi:hypothetical protein
MASKQITSEIIDKLIKPLYSGDYNVRASGTYYNNIEYYRWSDNEEYYKLIELKNRILSIFDMTFCLVSELNISYSSSSYKEYYDILSTSYKIVLRANKAIIHMYNFINRKRKTYRLQEKLEDIATGYVRFVKYLTSFEKSYRMCKRIIKQKHSEISIDDMECSIYLKDMLNIIKEKSEFGFII